MKKLHSERIYFISGKTGCLIFFTDPINKHGVSGKRNEIRLSASSRRKS